ncbi:hypothetical protein ACQ3I4_08640 [Zafaria sp. Z1313]|uniref:hypothetical protein n=1 Tax=unclassified Zafaria TaxID=2828765 RepID=UPI002E75BA30|nr:hypothetical protein [Zafaria sp. J156]MEE1621733.1 hypothetical protein [Zafaria sp. J156]
MLVQIFFLVAAVISLGFVAVSCLRASREGIGYAACLWALLAAYGIPLLTRLKFDDSFDNVVFVSATTLSVSGALTLGSVFRPIRVVIYLFYLMGARFTGGAGTPEHEINRAARKENLWYAVAAAVLYTVFYFTTLLGFESMVTGT